MNGQNKKIMAPIIVTVCITLYYTVTGIVLCRIHIPVIIKAAVLIFSAIITVLLITALIERIKEIKRGEEDDLGKY